MNSEITFERKISEFKKRDEHPNVKTKSKANAVCDFLKRYMEFLLVAEITSRTVSKFSNRRVVMDLTDLKN